jgi:hypothetical protein
VGSAAQTTANTLDRPEDPVVITGANLASFAGEDPDSIAGFRYQAGWVQIPVQVDEIDVLDFGVPYDTLTFGVTIPMYTDEGTFTGADSDATVDADDELVFMAKDAGAAQAPAAGPDPGGVRPGTRREIKVTNPLNGNSAFVYLFVTDGTLPQHAGVDYVDYGFVLDSGDYKTTYNILTGPNPENSEVSTGYYRVHFSDRWIRDEVNVKAGMADEADILDRHKNLFGPSICGRSEDTFSNGEGCFVANIDGPVRAIRSYLGANSGPFTQRVHKFYERRHDVTTYLRVHQISGVMDYYDYSPAAVGMTYYNDLNTGGAAIDGDPSGDAVTAGAIQWEMVTGNQGTLAMAEGLVTDIPGFAYTSYYSDDSTTSVTQCTGDSSEYGASGVWVDQGIPNTDPYIGAAYRFEATRVVYYEPPHQDVPRAQALAAQANTPLILGYTTSVVTGPPPPVLMQNTPNPFGNRTTIRFTVPEGTRPVIRVYDVSGRLVKTLPAATIGAAGGRAVWDGTDRTGTPVTSGIYFYRLTIDDRVETRKMLLVR